MDQVEEQYGASEYYALSPAVRGHIAAVWQYLACADIRQHADFILLMGCSDFRVAHRAGQLYFDHVARRIVVSGGNGTFTAHWTCTEAEAFRRYLMRMGVPESAVDLESEAGNCLQNLQYTRKMVMEVETAAPRSGVLVTKPYACRRVLATALAQWREVSWQVTGPALSYVDFATPEHSLHNMVCLMADEVFKLVEYSRDRSDVVSMLVPQSIAHSAYLLKKSGFLEIERSSVPLPAGLFE